MSARNVTEADLEADGPVNTENWLGTRVLSYPRRPENILDVLDRATRLWPDEVAFVDELGTSVTYAEFADLVASGAEELTAYGLHSGDRVAVAARNRVAFAVAIFACAAARVVMVGLNTRLAAQQWSYMLERSRARWGFADEESLDDLANAAASVGLDVERVQRLTLGDGKRGQWPPSGIPPEESETYAVVWTSGTTGRPKASQVVHRCSVHSGMSYQRTLGLRRGDRTAVVFPLHYISAMHAHVLPTMLAGGTCVLVETTDQGCWLDLLAQWRIAWAYAVPAWWERAAADPRLSAEYLPALRIAGSGGAPFSHSLVRTLRERLPGTRLHDIYGLSETHSPAAILNDEEFEKRPGSVGRALPCMEVEIRDSAGVARPPDEAGEIWLRGSLVTSGYLDDPESTRQAIQDGWFRTGDVGKLDADGYLYVLDRVKDMINRGGHKVFSAEVERLLRELPGVHDVAVVAAPDQVAGEAVSAFVVRSPDTRPSALEVKQWVRSRMADYAVPTIVRFCEELPRNTIGKIDKRALRARLPEPAEVDSSRETQG